jgi:hypothetical protein
MTIVRNWKEVSELKPGDIFVSVMENLEKGEAIQVAISGNGEVICECYEEANAVMIAKLLEAARDVLNIGSK